MELLGIADLAAVFIAYTLLVFGSAVFTCRPLLRGMSFFDSLLTCVVTGHFFLVMAVYVLGFFHVSSRPLFISLLALMGILVRICVDRRFGVVTGRVTARHAWYLLNGIEGPRLFLKKCGLAVRGSVSGFFREEVKGHVVPWLIYLFCTGFNLYYLSWYTRTHVAFGAPDEVVHTQWVQMLLQGHPFADGVYPFGFHNIAVALVRIFGFHTYTVMRLLGICASMWILTMMYLLMRRVFRSPLAPAVGYALFSLCDIFTYLGMFRYQFGLPQEYAMLFLVPIAVLLYLYLQDGNRRSLILFGMAVAMTITIHLYITLMAGAMCIAFGIVYLVRIFKKRYLIPLLLCGTLGLLAGALPLGVGLMLGYPLNGSFLWAAGVIANGDVAAEEQFSHVEQPDEAVDETEGTEAGAGTEGAGGAKQERGAALTIWDNFVERVWLATMGVPWFYLTLGCVAVGSLFCLGSRLAKRTVPQNGFLMSLILFYVFILILFGGDILHLPTLITVGRAAVFVDYMAAVMFPIPIEVLYRFCEGSPALRKGHGALTFAAIAAIAAVTFGGGHVKEPSLYYDVQTTGSAKTLYQIFRDYPDHSWTVVSTVDETSMVWNDGFHYELLDFLRAMENPERAVPVHIPTKYVFFFIEKRPIDYGSGVFLNENPPVRKEIRREDMEVELSLDTSEPSDYYEKLRAPIMARAYAWAQEYQKHFPREMSVVYEDDEFIAYRLIQDPYYTNDLTIEYK